jgi:hypothetical protein
MLDLPSPFTLSTLREGADAFAHTCAIAEHEGAGTLVRVRRPDLLDLAAVLEPEEKLASARLVLYAAMNAVADALASLSSPEQALAFDWPDAIRSDGVLLGGGRLGWPEDCLEGAVPRWMVFGVVLRAPAGAAAPQSKDTPTGLDVEAFVSSFARHLLDALREWSAHGARSQLTRWLQRYPIKAAIAADGDLVIPGAKRPSYARALQSPSWLDPESGELRV